MRCRTYDAVEGRSQEGRGFVFLESGKQQMGGGTTYRAILGGGGGGVQESFSSVRPPKPVLEGTESGIGLVCARSLSGKLLGVNKQWGGGETYHS